MKDCKYNIFYEKVCGFENGFYSVGVCSISVPELKHLHYHDVLELGVCLEGSGMCVTDKSETHYSAGDVQVILPFQPHYNTTDKDSAKWMFINLDLMKMSSRHISLDLAYFSELMKKIDVSGVFTKESGEDIHSRITEMSELFMSQTSERDTILDMLILKSAELITHLTYNKPERVDDYRAYKKKQSVLPAMNYVSEMLSAGKCPGVSHMASSCFMSVSYFRKVFVSVTGETPKSYITRMQTKKAAVLLATTEISLSELSAECGFEDNSTFYRSFMRVYGVSPREYRKKCRQD